MNSILRYSALFAVSEPRINLSKTTIGSILEGLQPEERSDLYLSVLFTNTNPTIHPAWEQSWLDKLVDQYYTYPGPDVLYQDLFRLEVTNSHAEKGIVDYTYALQNCYQQGARYVVMFEDDIILADGWFAHTLRALQDIENSSLKIPAEWLFMRLFNDEGFLGWGSQVIGSHNEFWITLGIVSGILGAVAIAKPRSKWARKHMVTGRLCVICLLAVPAFVILFFQAGKASALSSSPGVWEEPFGSFSSQGLVYPKWQIPRVVDYLRSKHRGQVDHLLQDLARETGLARHSLYPSQIQHIGMYFGLTFEYKEMANL